MKNKHYLIVTALMLFVSIVFLPMLVGAAPTTLPPTGVTDANFNSIKAGYGSVAPSKGADVKGTSYGITSDSTGLGGAGVYGTGITIGVAGYATGTPSTGGSFQATTVGALGSSITGSGVKGTTNTGYAVEGVASNAAGRAGRFQNSSAGTQVDLSTGAFAIDAVGNMQSTGYVSAASMYANYVQSNGTVYAGGNFSNPSLTIAQNGDISDNNSDVTINDGLVVSGNVWDTNSSFIINDSLEVNSWTSLYGGFNIYNGGIKNGIMDVSGNFRTKGVVTAGDDDLLLSTDSAVRLDTSGIIMNTVGGIRNNYSGQGVNITDDLNVTGTIYDNTGNLTVFDTIDLTGSLISNGTVQAQGLVATNGLSATNYITTSGYISTVGNILSNSNIQAPYGNISAGTGFPSARVHGTGSSYGVWGSGSTMGGRFEDSNGTSYTYNGYLGYGTYSFGDTAGGYFNDKNSSGYAYVAYGDRGMWGYGSFAGATFSNTTSGVWVDAAQGAFSIRGNGQIQGTAFNYYSDERLKDVKGDYRLGLDEISKLNPVEFKYKKGNSLNINSEEIHVGLLAQQVQKTIPQGVREGDDGYLSLEPNVVMITMINAIKELKAENEALKEVICEMEADTVFCSK